MTWGVGILFVGMAAFGGALNSVAGGGSFFTFPTLVFAQVPPIIANATSTAALWPGSLASAAGYRRELSFHRGELFWLGLPSLVGGVAGAVLLVRTPERTFNLVLPFLMLLATLVFSFGDRLRRRLLGKRATPLWPAVLAQLPISVYGGYFGGGIGLMMLATFTMIGLTDIHRMNGLKSALAVAINGAAIITFVLASAIDWPAAGLMTLGAIGGGYGGAALARRLDPTRVRAWVTAIAWVLTAWFFVRGYLR